MNAQSESTQQILDNYFSEADLASQLRVSVKTLRRWHMARRGPRRLKLGKRNLYSKAAVQEFMARAEQHGSGRRAR